ncbi:MAG: hypothetical protein JXA96_08465 [Sedimentisphaerales bacterium]|nr:hypothetical protein [Sedimentisphaerales bacterium]
MRKVTIVSTCHREKGTITAANLCRILEQIQPEVIFLEVSPDNFNLLYHSGTPKTLEPKAVLQFASNRNVELVPVDLSIHAGTAKEKADYRFKVLDTYSSERRKQIDMRINECMLRDGFEYLNGDQYSKDLNELDNEDLKVIRRLNDPKITELNEWWISINSYREDEMLRRIFEYSQINTFQEAVFLIGSAHRDAIFEKSKEQNDNLLQLVKWQHHTG